MMHDGLAILFFLVMALGAFMYRQKTINNDAPTVKVPRNPPPIDLSETKLGVHGAVLNKLYDCVEVGAEIDVEPSSMDVPDFGLVKHIMTQLCLRASESPFEFYHTTTVYAATKVYDDGTKIHDICAMVHEKSTLTTVRVRFMCLCDNEDDGVTFLCMKFDPLDATPGHMLYSRSGDCMPCHKEQETDSMTYRDYEEWLKDDR